MTETPNRRLRVRPVFQRLAIVAIVLLTPVVVHAIWDYVELRRMVRALEAIRAKREPLTVLEAQGGYRQLSPDEERAGRQILAGAISGYPIGAGQRQSLDQLQQLVAGKPHPGLDLSQVAAALAEVTSNGADALAHVDQAAQLPFRGLPPGHDFSYREMDLLWLMQLQSMRTTRFALAGDAGRAVQSAIASLKIRPSLQLHWQRPITPDVAAILSFASPGPEALAALASEITRADDPDRVTKQTRSDRARYIEHIFRQYYGGDPDAPYAYRLPYRSFAALMWRPYFTHRFVDLLQRWEKRVDASRLPWPEKERQMAATYSGDDPDSPQRRRLRRWSYPRDMDFALAEFPPPFLQIIGRERAAVAAIAVCRFRQEHGRLPQSLDELAPKYLSEVPQDPASGKPLLFKVAPDAFTVYSVGSNGVDDGGDLTSGLDRRPARLEGADVGIRVLTRVPSTEVKP